MKTLKNFFLLLIFTTSILGQAKVSFIRGKVHVQPHDSEKWDTVKQGDLVESGSKIRTGNASSVTLLYGKSELKLYQNTTLVLKELPTEKNQGNFSLESGFSWFKFEGLSKKGVIVSTPTSTAAVRGTAFATLYDAKEKQAMNCTCHGSIEVSNGKGKTKLVSKGNGSAISENSNEIDLASYAGEIEKQEALPKFEARVKKSPIMLGCLSCHKPKGWQAQGILSDEKYSK